MIKISPSAYAHTKMIPISPYPLSCGLGDNRPRVVVNLTLPPGEFFMIFIPRHLKSVGIMLYRLFKNLH